MAACITPLLAQPLGHIGHALRLAVNVLYRLALLLGRLGPFWCFYVLFWGFSIAWLFCSDGSDRRVGLRGTVHAPLGPETLGPRSLNVLLCHAELSGHHPGSPRSFGCWMACWIVMSVRFGFTFSLDPCDLL